MGLQLWTRTWGGTDQDSGRAVTLDTAGNIHITGLFQDTVDFDPGAGTDSHTANGSSDAFLSRFSSAGIFQLVRAWGTTSSESSNGVAVDGSLNPFVTGGFGNTVDFAPTDPPCNAGSDNHTSNGGSDVFLLKYLPNGCW